MVTISVCLFMNFRGRSSCNWHHAAPFSQLTFYSLTRASSLKICHIFQSPACTQLHGTCKIHGMKTWTIIPNFTEAVNVWFQTTLNHQHFCSWQHPIFSLRNTLPPLDCLGELSTRVPHPFLAKGRSHYLNKEHKTLFLDLHLTWRDSHLKYDPAIPLLGISTKELKGGTGTDFFYIYHSNVIHNSQKVETPQMSSNSWINKVCCIHVIEYYSALRKQGNSGTCY
jgi:hypothetical protein